MRIDQKLARLHRILRKSGLYEIIPKIYRFQLNGKYWRKLTSQKDGKKVSTFKRAYLRLMSAILKNKEFFDPHLAPDDPAFQEAIISGVELYENQCSETLSDNFLKSKTFGWPYTVREQIAGRLGSYTVSEQLHALEYYLKTDHKNSRSRRYDEDGNPVPIPVSVKGRAYAFKFLDTLLAGKKYASQLPLLTQSMLLIQAMPGGTQSGYPFFVHQTKDNVIELVVALANHMNFELPPEISADDSKDYELYSEKYSINGKVYGISIEWIDKLVSYAERNKIFPPFILFYRTHWDKVRCVFGAGFLMKLLGMAISVSKHFGYHPDVNKCDEVNEDIYDLKDEKELEYVYDEDSSEQQKFDVKLQSLPPVLNKKIYSPNNIPYISHLNWDIQNNLILDKLPPSQEGKVLAVSSEWLKNHFGIDLPEGEYDLNCIGEDYSKFDTGIIPEDLQWITEHKGLGKWIQYTIDCFKNSEVWLGNQRFLDIIFKSGGTFTTILGTIFHQNAIYAYEEWAQKNDEIENKPIVVAAICQSDDSLIWIINCSVPDMIEFNKFYGMIINPEATVDFKKDLIVTFLQNHLGVVLRFDDNYHAIGNPQSRYSKLAHSERDVEKDLVNMYRVTNDKMLDAAISKLASYGSKGGEIVLAILKIVRNTTFGRRLIRAIGDIDPTKVYLPYRSDVSFSNHPSWLGTLPVQELAVSTMVARATV